MQEVVDPALLSQLNGTNMPPIQQLYDPNPEQTFSPPLAMSGMNSAPAAPTQAPVPQEVTDPSILAQLNGSVDNTPPQAQNNSFLGDMKQNEVNAGQAASDLYNGNYQDFGRSVPGTAGVALADKLFPPGSDGSLSDALHNAGNTKPSDYSSALLEKFGQTPEGKALTVMGGAIPSWNAVSTLVNRDVNPAIANHTGVAPANLQLAEILGGAASGAKTSTPDFALAKGLAGKLSEHLGNESTEIPTTGAPSYDPIAGQRAMADTYAGNKAQSGALYNKINQLASGVPVDTQGLDAHLANLIGDVQSDPMRGAYSTLPKLKAIQGKVNSGTFDLADAVDLKKDLNSQFKSNQYNQNAAGTAYADLNGKIGSIIGDASKANPEFGAANDLAHNYWLNNVQNPFQDNAVMAKYFRSDDYNEINSLDKGRSNALHDETLQRANSTVGNIKNPVQLDAVRRVLPDDLADALSKAVIKNQGAGGRLGAGVNLAKNLASLDIGGALHSAADVIGGVQKTPAQAALIKAAKSPAPRMATAEALAQQLAATNDYSRPAQPEQVAPPQLAIPYRPNATTYGTHPADIPQPESTIYQGGPQTLQLSAPMRAAIYGEHPADSIPESVINAGGPQSLLALPSPDMNAPGSFKVGQSGQAIPSTYGEIGKGLVARAKYNQLGMTPDIQALVAALMKKE